MRHGRGADLVEIPLGRWAPDMPQHAPNVATDAVNVLPYANHYERIASPVILWGPTDLGGEQVRVVWHERGGDVKREFT